MGLRAFTIYLIALLLLRIGGIRTFGKKSTFDMVVSILLGAVLSRAVVGASPYWPTVFAGLVIVVLHRILAWLCMHYSGLGTLLKGKERILYQEGHFSKEDMDKSFLTEGDLLESVRLQTNCDSMDQVKKIYLERSGRISVILKAQDKS